MKKRIKKIFITGFIAIIPIAATVYIVFFIVGIIGYLVKILPEPLQPDNLLGFHVPGLDFILALLFIFFVGLVIRSFMGRWLVASIEEVIDRIPMVSSVYASMKKMVDAVVSAQSESFKNVVIIEYPRKGIYALAFMTGEAHGEVQDKTAQRCVNVFLPTTPNPTSGFFLMVPEEDVTVLKMSVEDAFRLIISGGIITPHEAVILKAMSGQEPPPVSVNTTQR